MSGSHIVAAGVFRRPAKCRRDRHSPMGWLDGALAVCALALATGPLGAQQTPPQTPAAETQQSAPQQPLPETKQPSHQTPPQVPSAEPQQPTPQQSRLRRLLQKPSTLRPKRPLLKLSSLHLSNHRLRHPPPNPRSPLSRHLRRRRLPPKLSSPRLRHHRLKLSSRRHPALANKSTRAQPAAWTPMPGCRICWPITSFFASSLNWISCRPNRHSSTAAF
jgi:hypothetical protein